MFTLKTDANKVLGLAGIGSKAIQNIEEALGALSFPEPEIAPEPEAVKVDETVAVAPETVVAEPVTAEEMPATKKPGEGKKEAKKVVEEAEDENAKDGVSLEELFKMKPETFQTPAATEEDDDKKKGKKGKKKGVALEFDEDLGAVVGRKKHKRGDEAGGEEW